MTANPVSPELRGLLRRLKLGPSSTPCPSA